MGRYTTKLDPARWSERSQGIALLAVIAMFLGVIVGGFFGFGRDAVLPACLVVSLGAFGALYWRTLGVPWGDIASWTVPLTIWMAAVVAVPPPLPWGILGWVAGCAWFSLFVAGTPVIPWWYGAVLRKPFPSALQEDGPGDGQ
jgi:hypothetical protein